VISTTSRLELSSSFSFLQGKVPKEIHAILTETLGEHAPLYATVKNWVAQFKRGDFSSCDAPRPGRPKTVTTPEIIDQIHELILDDRWTSAKSIAEHLGISRKWVGSIILEDLDMRKLSAKWVPKCLNADQKCQRCQSSEQLLEFFQRDRNDFLSRLVTMDETWIYHYDPETKQQPMEWQHSSSPCAAPKKPGYITMTWRQSNNQWSGSIAAHPVLPQKIPSAKMHWKSSRLDLWDQDGILLIDYLPKGQTINAEYYSFLLV